MTTGKKLLLLTLMIMALAWSLQAELREDSDRLGFGNVYVGTHHARTYIWTNANDFPITFYQMILEGSPAYSLGEMPQLPLFCAPGDGFSFELDFDPLWPGTHISQIYFRTDHPTQPEWFDYNSGLAFWSTIPQLPYFMDCDTEFADGMPAGWSRISSNTPGSQVGLGIVDYTHQQFLLSNGNTASSLHNFLLISPHIADSLDFNLMRLKLMLKSSPDTQPLILGTMTDPADLNTFVACDTLYAGYISQEYIVNLSGFDTGGRYLAFRHPVSAPYQNYVLDDITIEYIPDNDLSVIAISGESHQSVMSECLIWAEVMNRGLRAQTNYQVSLEGYYGNTLGVSPGLPIAAGERLLVPVIWQPTETGEIRIYGNLENNGDQNPLNNRSPFMRFVISDGCLDLCTIGTGELEARIPMDLYYKYSIFETILYPAEIGRTGIITGLQFYKNFGTAAPRTYNVYIGETQQTNLNLSWIPSSLLSLVYSGTITFSFGTVLGINFQNPYHYNGGNLVVMISNIGFGASDIGNSNFRCQYGGSSRSRWATHNLSTPFNPVSPPLPSTISNMFPMTTLVFGGDANLAGVAVSPQIADFGFVPLDTVQSQVFRLSNQGTASFSVTSFSLSGDEAFTVLEQSALPRLLLPGQHLLFSIAFSPPAGGTFRASLLVTDNSGRTIYNFPVKGSSGPWEITDFPVALNFDQSIQDDLPRGWIKHVVGYANASISRSYENPHSQPASLLFSNGIDSSPTMLIASAPIANSVDISGLRLKYWARTNYPTNLLIGLADDPTQPSDFFPLAEISLDQSWTLYSTDFSSYTNGGHGNRLVIRSLGGVSSNAVFLDDLRLEQIPARDLELSSFISNSSPSLNHPSYCEVEVRNWGTENAQNFTIRLLDDSASPITSFEGSSLNSGERRIFNFQWQSSVPLTSIRAEVLLTGDENSLNNTSAPVALEFCQEGEVISVGAGFIPAPIPFDYSKRASLYQCIIPRDKFFGFYGLIHGLSLDYAFNLQVPSRPIKIWIGRTNQIDLCDGWIPLSEQSLVVDDSLDAIPAGENRLSFIFEDSFDFRWGENLVISFLRPNDNINHGPFKDFRCHHNSAPQQLFFSSEINLIDPVYPPEGELTDIVPNIRFIVSTGGTGSLSCLVRDPQNQPLSGVEIELVNSIYTTQSDDSGSFGFAHIVPGTYQLHLTKFAYQQYEQEIQIEVDQATSLNLVLQPFPIVTIHGRILGSDTGSGIANASIHLSGYQAYSSESLADGWFQINTVYGLMPYEYIIVAGGYQTLRGTWLPGSSDLIVGDIFLSEIAYSPLNAQAQTQSEDILITWEAPNTSPVGLQESFEAEDFPPSGWSQIINNIGPLQTSGLLPTWCRSGAVNPGIQAATPPHGSYQAGLSWASSHQDEWLISPPFNCPTQAHLSFQTYVFQGSTAGDHYSVKLSTDNGNTWSVIWDASAQSGGWNYYQDPVQIDLASYSGQDIKLAFHAEDPPTDDGLWYVWLIDNVYVGNVLRSKHNRSQTSYRVNRLLQGTEADSESWVQLANPALTELSYLDTNWANLPAGEYRWAVQAVYQANVLSEPIFTNVIIKTTPTGMISGVVRQSTHQPIAGATVSTGSIHTSTNNSGAYTLLLPTGTYVVTARADNFQSQTIEALIVNEDQTTSANFTLEPGSDAGLDVPPVATDLLGNYPNPFNPQTHIRYSLREASDTSLKVYNQRGQFVRHLVQSRQLPGYYTATWNGKDADLRDCASGIYLIRMTAGSWSKTIKVMLLK